MQFAVPYGKGELDMKEKTLGIMLDCSRNAVMKPEEVKRFAKLIADMGYNMLQLYTEDTYEIENEPYFGHMRGRYTKKELQDMDAYCSSIGVELVPCIQTLAHLLQLKQWEVYEPLFDCNDILLVGDDRVYALIEKMFTTLEECFTSRRVNVGMDEAHFIGRGKYLDIHGYRNRVDVLTEHLKRVKEIADRHGFQIMMWSDMFIRLHNGGDYYGEGIEIPQEIIDKVPEGIELIYWDYYHKEKSVYDEMIKTHQAFQNPVWFAGGMWTWTGYVANLRLTWDVTEAAMRSVTEHKMDRVFFTLWGDNGKDCSFYTQLPMLFAAAQMANGNFDKEAIFTEFQERYGYKYEEFLNLELLNLHENKESCFNNPNKYLFFNDPFIGLFDSEVSEEMPERLEKAAALIGASVNGRHYDYLFETIQKLAEVLARKIDLGIRTRKAYQSGDRECLLQLANVDYPKVRHALESFFTSYRRLWLLENKGFGIEVQEQRFGGLLYRMSCCEERILAYLDGKTEQIEELEEKGLARCAGELTYWNAWNTTVTANIM